MSAMGDLTGRGTRDWVGLVHVSSPADKVGGIHVVVFLQQPDDHYLVSAQTAGQLFNCGTGSCSINAIRVARKSVFVTWNWQWRGCSDEVTFQFKQKGSHWPLIGVVGRSMEGPYGTDENDNLREGPVHTMVVDHNRVTGDVIVTQRVDKRAARVTKLKIASPVQELGGFDGFDVPGGKGIPAICAPG